MNNSEIRIGNIVTTSSPDAEIQIPSMLPFIVFGIGFSKCELLPYLSMPWACQEYIEIENRFIHPIPITPEWLERLGFEKDTILGKHYKYSKDGIEIWQDTTLNAFFVDNIKNKMVYFKYIHQLQNLYHAITGQELTVKELTPTTT